MRGKTAASTGSAIGVSGARKAPSTGTGEGRDEGGRLPFDYPQLYQVLRFFDAIIFGQIMVG